MQDGKHFERAVDLHSIVESLPYSQPNSETEGFWTDSTAADSVGPVKRTNFCLIRESRNMSVVRVVGHRGRPCPNRLKSQSLRCHQIAWRSAVLCGHR